MIVRGRPSIRASALLFLEACMKTSLSMLTCDSEK